MGNQLDRHEIDKEWTDVFDRAERFYELGPCDVDELKAEFADLKRLRALEAQVKRVREHVSAAVVADTVRINGLMCVDPESGGRADCPVGEAYRLAYELLAGKPMEGT